MIGNLIIDKASSNMSYFLYAIKILHEYSGRISRKEFVKAMADFAGKSPHIGGKENRTLYNKSNFPRYFGFIDSLRDADGSEVLVLTKRGEKLSTLISERPNYQNSEDHYYVKHEDQPELIKMLFDSIIFDSFGRNNCGVKTSCSDVEPPKILFKTLAILGRATAAELYYIFYSLDNGIYKTYDAAITAIKANRESGKYDYSNILEQWGQKNSVGDCKIIKIFTDNCINLLISEEDGVIGETFYRLNPQTTQNYQKVIGDIKTVYTPLQMAVYATNMNAAEQWLNETVLGRIGNSDCVTVFDRLAERNSETFLYDVLIPAVAKAYDNQKRNHYLVILNADSEQTGDLFGQFAPLLARTEDLAGERNGFSSNGIEDENAYSKLTSLSANAGTLLSKPKVLLPPNFHIVSIGSETSNMSRDYDYTFTQCLINADTDGNTEGPNDSSDIFEGFQPWLTSYNNPDYTGKEKYAGYPKALVRLVDFMKEQGLIDDTSLNDLSIEKYHNFLAVYESSEAVRDFDETKLSSKAGGAALKKYIKYMAYLLRPHAVDFDYSITAGAGENKIFFGTPGCGKSYYIDHDLLGKDKDTKKYTGDYNMENIIRTTFYQDYSNTDFVGQILPKVVKGNGEEKNTVEYIFNPGPFTLALIRAISNPGRKVALVVEEINRGNAPAIFGDIFQLLDRDNDGISEYGIVNVSLIDYLNNYKFVVDGQRKHYTFKEIRIPGNLDIFATMNTSDQNVYTLDTAFVRRWEKVKVKNDFSKCTFRERKVPGMEYTWEEFADAINTWIAASLDDLQVNEDKQLGVFFVKESLLVSGDAEKFAYKVFDYLWNDVTKLDHGMLFDNKFNTLDQLITAYTKIGIKVFKNPNMFKKLAVPQA